MIDLDYIQKEIKCWGKRNFPGAEPYYCILGVVEEVGELSRAHLKPIQGIRLNENHKEAERDAIGDISIFLMHFCAMRGYLLSTIIEQTWEEVRKRDWRSNPETGLPEIPRR
jgi:NTP pyrophosphatase (non-canonical NTP hydrolase)